MVMFGGNHGDVTNNNPQLEQRQMVLFSGLAMEVLMEKSSELWWASQFWSMSVLQDGAPKIAKLPYKWLYGRYN